ncbi:hypothetical protein DICSQDRAFT_175790 [Dichomitus squalens LYAD-421 SS1]|uniref:Uncharacterized protein n=1 Tax=Dichomitus squalens (strain LYAD-421) TaxID=732165 RepID=R7SII6_DICSQ|nr:uncharacterized protein DICSQDRAFT_175790 [Dichomitus squalens LYAD-421 SS1]EJF55535.1 hypothetical protein DICSQDRAFT_175790 [Dichomitus squalens LYAD-421 SS1]
MGTRKSSRVDSHKKKKTSRPRARPGGEYKTPKAQRRRGGDRLTAPATPSRSQYSDKLRQTCELKRETRLPYDFDQTHSLKCVKCNTVGRWVARTGYAERCAGVWLYKGSIQEPGTDIRVSCPNWVRPNQPPVPDWLKHKIKAVRDLDAKGAANDSSPSTLGSKIDSAVGSLGTSTSPEQLESDHAYAQSLYAQEVAQYEPRQGASDEAGPSGSRTAPAAFDTTKSTSQGLTAKRKAAQLQQEATDELDQMRHNKFIQTLKGTNNVVISRQDMSSPEQSPEPSTPSPAARRPTSATAIGNTTSASGPVRNASSQVAEKPSAPIMPRKRSMSCISISSTEEPTVVVKRERHDSVLSLSDDEPAEHERHDSVLSLSDDEPAGRERHRMSDSTLESSNKENHVPATTKKVFALVKTIPFVTFTSTPKKPSRQTSQLQSPREASADVFHPDEDDASPMPPDKSDVYDISPTVSELAKEATLDEPRYVPGTPGADEKSLSPIGQSLLPRNRARNDLPENDDIPRARNRNPCSGPWKPPLECTDDTKAPYDTDYEDSDAPVTPERPADTPLPSSNGPAVSDIYGPLIRSVIQLRAHVDALPPDARAKVVATVTKFHEETGTVADLMALLPSPSSGSGKDKHEESPSDTNTRNKRK